MVKFSKRELEVLELMREGVKHDSVIGAQIGITAGQVAVHKTDCRRKIIGARKFYKQAMKDYGRLLFPERRYKGV